jgi:hypothetical protein
MSKKLKMGRIEVIEGKKVFVSKEGWACRVY